MLIFPASQYAVGSDKMQSALSLIERDMRDEVKAFQDSGKLLEAQRLEQRTTYDLEMMKEIGYCSGVENYSRYFDGRSAGEPSFTLLDSRNVSRRQVEKGQPRRIRLPVEVGLRQQTFDFRRIRRESASAYMRICNSCAL